MSNINKNKTKKEGLSTYFVFFSILFTACLLTANIIAVKIITIFGLFVPAGIVVFPISYIFGDILTEVYGYGQAKKVIWFAFAGNLLMVFGIWIALNIQAAPFWTHQSSFNQILGFTPRLLLASFTAFLIGSFANSFVMSRMKIITKGKMLWTRTIGSTLVAEGLDSLIFIMIAFIGSLPLNTIPGLIFTQWILKSFYEVIMTPLTYIIIAYLKRKEDTDLFDYNVRYNPFTFDS